MAKIRDLEITSSNVKALIGDIDVNTLTGDITIKFSLLEPRDQPATLFAAQYKLDGGIWEDMTLADEGQQKDVAISTVGDKWLQSFIVWNAPEDVPLAAHIGVLIRLQFKDNESTADDYREGDAFDFDFTPLITVFELPKIFTKDTTPEFKFDVPPALHPCNMHFELKIANDEKMTDVVTTIDSSANQTGWWIWYRGEWLEMLSLGCPDNSALFNKGECKYELTGALQKGQYYYKITAVSVTKREPTEEIVTKPEDMNGYPFNY